MVVQSVQGLVKLAGLATRADRNQRQQPRITRRIAPAGRRHECAQLPEGIAEDVGQPVAVLDQMLDGVDPAAVFATAD